MAAAALKEQHLYPVIDSKPESFVHFNKAQRVTLNVKKTLQHINFRQYKI